MQQLDEDLNDVDGKIISLSNTVIDELGNAMSTAITGLIDGTATAEEAFSQMFKNIGAASLIWRRR